MKTIDVICLVMLLTGTLIAANTNDVSMSVSNRLDTIRIPSFEMQNARAEDVLEFLVSEATTPTPEPPREQSLGLIYTNAPETSNKPILDHSLSVWSNMPVLNMDLRRVTLREALNHVSRALALRYEVTSSNLLVFTEDGILLNKK